MTRHTAHLVTDTSISVFVDGKPYTISKEHPKFKEVGDALKLGDYSKIVSLMDVRQSVLKFLSLDKAFSLVGDRVTFDGFSFSDVITNKVLAMLEKGFNAEPLFNFLRKVRKNPSATAQDELLLFCEANKFMIHEDGDLLAYKAVRANYTDVYSGKFSNHVGAVVSMDRSQVDDDRDRTCSFGLHFAAYEYASTFHTGGHLMVMKINPADVVSIPSDYHNQKGRCARYEVISEVKDYTRLVEKEVYSNRDLGLDEPECAECGRFELECECDPGFTAGYECGLADVEFFGVDAENPYDEFYAPDACAGWRDGFNTGLDSFRR